MKQYAVLFFVLVLLIACKEKPKNQAEVSAVATKTKVEQTALDIEPSFQQVDSLEILYYDNPDGDPERYTRFFKFTPTNDTITIQNIIQNLRMPINATALKTCRSEGKIYCRNKSEIINTLYFSTRGDSCSYLYYIKSGNFYYVPISNASKQSLTALKKAAKKPREK
ncbi:MAG: hypothetical protein ACOVNY_13170 [Chitinophagaceae bacterium]